MKSDLPHPARASGRRRPARAGARLSARIEFSGVRNSWLMFDRKRDFISSARRRWSARSSSSAYRATTPRLVSSSSRLTRDELVLPGPEIGQRGEQLVVLPLKLGERDRPAAPGRAPGSVARGRPASRSGVPGAGACRSQTVVPLRRRVDVEAIHEPASADQPEPHAGRRPVLAPRGSGRAPGSRARGPSRAPGGSGAAVWPSSTKSTWPPCAYSKALRAISDVAVAMRVWSWTSKPRSRAMVRARCRARTTSPSRRIVTVRRGRLMRPAWLATTTVTSSWGRAEVAVEQAGDQPGMAPDHPGIAVEAPVRWSARRSA